MSFKLLSTSKHCADTIWHYFKVKKKYKFYGLEIPFLSTNPIKFKNMWIKINAQNFHNHLVKWLHPQTTKQFVNPRIENYFNYTIEYVQTSAA